MRQQEPGLSREKRSRANTEFWVRKAKALGNVKKMKLKINGPLIGVGKGNFSITSGFIRMQEH